MLFAGEGDDVVDQPTDNFSSQNVYGTMVYAKAALGFAAIRRAVGDSAFFTGLASYAGAFAFSFAIAAPDDLRYALEQASGQDLAELWSHWFEAAEGLQDFSPDDLTQLRRDLGE
jgi:aminopeptidase N